MKKLSPVFVLLAGSLWGTMGLFVRRFNANGLESMDIVAVRSLLTAIIMLIFLLIYKPSMLKIKLKDIWCFLGTGLLSILFFNFCYFKSIELTSMSVAAVLMYTAPAFVMIFSRFLFGEKFTAVKTAALVMTIAGCAFESGIISGGGVFSFGGIMAGFGAGLGYALYSIFSRFAFERGYHTFTIIFYTFMFTAVGSIPMSHAGMILDVWKNNIFDFLYMIIFVLVSTIVPYICYTVGLKDMENGTASIIASIEPVVATVLGFIAFSETLSVFEVIGIILVLGGIVVCNIRRRAPQK